MHTFVCIVGLPYRLIIVCEHDIICVCVYTYINVLTKLMYFQQILYLLGVNTYYGYGYSLIESVVPLPMEHGLL